MLINKYIIICIYRLPKIKEYVDKNDAGAMIIPFSGAFEQKLVDCETDDERKAYCDETKCTRCDFVPITFRVRLHYVTKPCDIGHIDGLISFNNGLGVGPLKTKSGWVGFLS